MGLFKRSVLLASILLPNPGFAELLGPSPVVVELFESQGCSSCPPAERVMQELREEFGAQVVLLTFHVDYWDYLGWRDPFSDPRWTERQKRYGQRFNQDSIYTPEMVIQGQVGFVGSDSRRARQEVNRAVGASRPGFSVTMQRENAGARVIAEFPPALATQVRDLLALRVEQADPVSVLRGENAGRTMSGAHAVRALIPMGVPVNGRSTVSFALNQNPAPSAVIVLAIGAQGEMLAAQTADFPPFLK